jgi:hypothetical protein
MHVRSLTHLLEGLRAWDAKQKIVILGSSSLVTFHPEFGEPGGPLDLTCNADFLLEDVNKEIALSLGQALGENKAFYLEFGYHADILHPSIIETLPPGWDARVVAVSGFENVFALQPLDLAAVKIVVGREKDLALVRRLLELGKIRVEDLRKRWSLMALGKRELFRSRRNLEGVTKGGCKK